jgi:uncharacterized protein (TIGR00645 family)
MEKLFERGLFASRWLMAPFYAGLVGALVVLLIAFMKEFFSLYAKIITITQNDAVLGVLGLIDLSLAGNLLLIVIFSGYENFVSKLDIDDHVDKFDWKGSVDFASLKLKLIASIVAISAIQLLKIFMDVKEYNQQEIIWKIVIHLVIVVSGVLLALMDKIALSSKLAKGK